MHIPAQRIYREMRSEEAGAWFVPANGGEETAVLVKAPTSSLKALISGCKLSFVFGLASGHLCTGVRIYDVPDAPVLLCSVQRHEEEHATVKRISRERNFPIFLFNELDVCVAWSTGQISEADGSSLSTFLASEPNIYSGTFTEEASAALDSFCVALDPSQGFAGTRAIATIEIQLALGPWTSNNISFAGVHDLQTIVLDDVDEGSVLEKAVWASLESVFPLTLYKSPQVQVGSKLRELTDVAAFYGYGTFLIEAKDLSVLRAGTERTRERRLRGVQKQAKSAIEQLIGASKAVKRGDVVTDLKGNRLSLVLDKPLHCIVLLTEFMHEGDWREIESLLRAAMVETGDFFHVVDLRELIALLKASNGEPHRLDYNLMQRCERFIESGTFISVVVSPPRLKGLSLSAKNKGVKSCIATNIEPFFDSLELRSLQWRDR